MQFRLEALERLEGGGFGGEKWASGSCEGSQEELAQPLRND